MGGGVFVGGGGGGGGGQGWKPREEEEVTALVQASNVVAWSRVVTVEILGMFSPSWVYNSFILTY